MTDNKKNILYIIPTMEGGGVEIGMIELCKKVNETKDFNIFILTTEGKLISKAEYYGVIVIKMDVKTKNPIKIYKNIDKISEIIKKYKIDIVEVESRAPAWSAYYACKKLNIPFITTIHGAYSIGGCLTSFLKKKYNSIMLKGDQIIVVSNFIKSYCLDHYRKFISDISKINVIHRGIDTNIYNSDNVSKERIIEIVNKFNIPADRIIITLPGRITPIKGQDYLIEALKLVKHKNFYCILVGKKDKHKKYIEKIFSTIKSNNFDNIKIVDDIADIEALYMVSDIVISATTKPESFGRISIEAQSMKRIFIPSFKIEKSNFHKKPSFLNAIQLSNNEDNYQITYLNQVEKFNFSIEKSKIGKYKLLFDNLNDDSDIIIKNKFLMVIINTDLLCDLQIPTISSFVVQKDIWEKEQQN